MLEEFIITYLGQNISQMLMAITMLFGVASAMAVFFGILKRFFGS